MCSVAFAYRNSENLLLNGTLGMMYFGNLVIPGSIASNTSNQSLRNGDD